jgi:hypothetical protein
MPAPYKHANDQSQFDHSPNYTFHLAEINQTLEAFKTRILMLEQENTTLKKSVVDLEAWASENFVRQSQ